MFQLVFNNYRSEFGRIRNRAFVIFIFILEFTAAFLANSGVQFIETNNAKQDNNNNNNNNNNNSNINNDMNYYLDPDELAGDISYPAMFPQDINNINCCSHNSSFCSDTFNEDCACDTSNLSMEQCRCSCPATIKAIDYTVRLAAGVAIVILVGVSITLAISLYRRAVSGYDNTLESGRRPSGSPISVITTTATTTVGRSIRDSPPRYDDIFVSNESVLSANISYNKLPSYEEALRSSTSSEEPPSLSTEIGKTEPAQIKMETETVVISNEGNQCHIITPNGVDNEPVCGSIDQTPSINYVIRPNTNLETSNNLNHSDC